MIRTGLKVAPAPRSIRNDKDSEHWNNNDKASTVYQIISYDVVTYMPKKEGRGETD